MTLTASCRRQNYENFSMNPHNITKEFEQALCEYTGAPYAVATTSCTMALLLACAYHKVGIVTIPKHTYVSVPQSIIHAGGTPTFEKREWSGLYKLEPYPIWDSARWFSSKMYQNPGQFMCVSFHWSKTLGLGQGGAILHDSPEADAWFRRARFDGRAEGVQPKNDKNLIVGWHAYMSPRDAAEGLSRLALLPKDNDPLPNDDYPDLSQMEAFQ